MSVFEVGFKWDGLIAQSTLHLKAGFKGAFWECIALSRMVEATFGAVQSMDLTDLLL